MSMHTIHQAMTLIENYDEDEDILLNPLHPFSFAAKLRNDDTPNYREAMEGPDQEGFIKAMDIEIETLTGELQAWNVVNRSVPLLKK